MNKHFQLRTAEVEGKPTVKATFIIVTHLISEEIVYQVTHQS